jgi:hypothetical protein
MVHHSRKMVIHQCLHGYSEGHRLLKSSTGLPRAAERALLILSDLSGPSGAAEFSSYISGYPVPETDLYAIGRTWLAPEMGRPGCVWTHTLLVASHDLAALEDPYCLDVLFSRPNGRDHAYDRPLELEPKPPESGQRSCQDSRTKQILELCVQALYSTDQNPVLLLAEDSSTFEASVFALWKQQWPALRRAFRFCTGSLANRELNGTTFDLQVVPSSRSRQIHREIPKSVLVNPENIRRDETRQKWIEVVVDDLCLPTGGAFRSFLRQFAIDVQSERSRMAALAKVFGAIELLRSDELAGRLDHLTELIEAIANSFPEPSDGASLKRALFYGESRAMLPSFDYLSNEAWLEAAFRAEVQAHADLSFLNIEERAQGLWHENRAAALRITSVCSESSPAPLRDLFVCGLAKLCRSEDLRTIDESNDRAVELFIRCRPELALSLSGSSVDMQRAALRGLLAPCPEATLSDMALQFITSSSSETLVHEALEHVGEDRKSVV